MEMNITNIVIISSIIGEQFKRVIRRTFDQSVFIAVIVANYADFFLHVGLHIVLNIIN